jgi:hypothetical protein
MKTKRHLVCVLAIGLLGITAVARADSGSWTNLTGGNWEVAGNWSGGMIAGGTDSTANFTGINVTADRTVTVDAGRTIGHLRFGDTVKSQQYGDWWILAGATLTLDVSTGQPTIRSNIDRTDTGSLTINATLAGNDGLLLDTGNMIRLNGASSYTGYTTISGITAIVGNTLAFGASALSLKKGALWATGDYTLANDVSLDGDFSFAYAGGSSYSGDIKFSKILMLNGNYALIHNGSSGGGYPQPTTFNAGVDDGGMGYILTIKNGTYNNDAFQLGAGSTYTNETVIHGNTLRLIGALDTTARVLVNRGGNLQAHGLRDATGFNNTRLDDSIPVVLRSGSISIYASYSSGVKDQDKETFGAVTQDYGHSFIEASGGRCITRLTITNLVRDSGTFFFNRYGQQLNGSGGRIFLTGQPAGFMGGWSYAQGADYPNATGYDFSWYDATAGVIPMLANVARPDQVEGAAATDHVKTTSAQTTLTANTSLASLCVTNGLFNNLGGFALDIVSGGLLNRAGVYVMSNGALTSSSGNLYLYNLGTAMTNSATITGVGVSVTTIGNQTLAGNNDFSGELTVNADTLTLSGVNTGIREAVVTPGSQLSLQNAGALPGTLTLKLLFDGEEYGKLNNPYANVVVQTLVLDGVKQLTGTYGATGSGCQSTNNNYFAGTGMLLVPEQPSGTLIMLK